MDLFQPRLIISSKVFLVVFVHSVSNSALFYHPGVVRSCYQWLTEGWGLGGSNPPPKFRSFDKAEPNSQFRGKYIRNNLIRIRVSLIYKLSGTPD
jgi:hypothetical protein